MHRVLSPCASAHRVLSSRASTRQICTADVNRRWRHHWHVTCWHHRPHLLMSPATLADVIIDKLLTCVDFDRWLWLRVDFDRWLFARVDFCNPGAPYPVFRVDFILQSIFSYFASKWRIRTGLLLVAIIVADNPTNVFAIFANIFATVLRLAIVATNQLFQFLLLLLLILRVSNQWIPSLHSLSLQDALSPCP